MEFPTLGNNCFVNTCKQLDFLPMKCDACSGLFCKDHIQYSEHHCDTAYTKDIQVPVCPLCNKPVPSKRGEPPDIKMSQHIDNDCQSDPAKEKRIFANRCSLKGCKQKELVPVMCSSCHQNYCIRHRHTTDHDCQGYDKSGKTVSRQGVAAINRATTSGQKPQETALAHIGRNLDKERRERLASRQQQMTLRDNQHGQSTQSALSEDEAMARAIQMSLADHQQSKQASNQQSHQEEEDMALAKALQESQLEERQRQNQVAGRSPGRSQSTDVSRCNIS